MNHYFKFSKYRVLNFCTQPPRRLPRRIWRAFLFVSTCQLIIFEILVLYQGYLPSTYCNCQFPKQSPLSPPYHIRYLFVVILLNSPLFRCCFRLPCCCYHRCLLLTVHSACRLSRLSIEFLAVVYKKLVLIVYLFHLSVSLDIISSLFRPTWFPVSCVTALGRV